jgi:hypothetical protein
LDDYDFDLDDPDDLDLRKRRTYRHPRTLWASRELVGIEGIPDYQDILSFWPVNENTL